MSRARFTEADVRRAVKGASAAGLAIARLDILPDGRISIVPAAANAQQGAEPDNMVEEYLRSHASAA